MDIFVSYVKKYEPVESPDKKAFLLYELLRSMAYCLCFKTTFACELVVISLLW